VSEIIYTYKMTTMKNMKIFLNKLGKKKKPF